MDASADIRCRNAEGLTPLMLAARDAQMFEKLGNKIVHDFAPVEVLCELISSNGFVIVLMNKFMIKYNYFCSCLLIMMANSEEPSIFHYYLLHYDDYPAFMFRS